MAITRRQFLKRSGVVAAGSALGPGLFGNPFVRTALSETIGDRYLIVLLLDGGNDGLNTVTPVDNQGGTLRTDYEGWRNTGGGGIRLLPGELAATGIDPDPNTGANLALHPGFIGSGAGAGGLKTLYDLGNVAVVQGCGYPEANLSHAVSSGIWETGDPLGLGIGYGNTGWVGRYLADPSTAYSGTDIPAVNISSSVAPEYRQTGTSVIAVNQLRRFGFPFDKQNDNGTQIQEYEDAFLAIHAEASASAQPSIALAGDAGSATFSASQSYPGLHNLYNTDRAAFEALYPNSSTGKDLKEIAKIIYGVETSQPNIDARHFWLRNGGYDTHSNEGGATGDHANLHNEVASAIKVFWDDITDMGAEDKVCILIWSEFSRRIQQNASGTDHGSQGPMFLIGGKVDGGVYGNHPNIDPAAVDNKPNTIYSQDPIDPFRSTDFRDVYGTVLKHWLNMPGGVILPNVLTLDTGFPVNTYWTTADFDLPLFLP